uniref:Uncharacterized protein n=1 Tax=Biomphalaria glabrata TaxID=6526 RepID=A0A2C9LCH1_BIOGL
MMVLFLLSSTRGQEKKSLIKSLQCRCMEVEIFLQEYFRSDISQWINFEKALNFNKQWDADIELAKISVVLIAIGVISKSQHYFFDCALELPEIMHSDLMSMLMSCMQSGSYKLVLTSRIEQVLLDKSGSQDQLQHIYSPLNSRVTSLCLFRNDSPLRARAYKLNYNQDNMRSPLCQSGEPLYSVLSPSRNAQIESSMESSVIISIHGEVTTSGYLFKLPLQVAYSSYLSKLPLQVTYSGYLFKLPLQVTSSSYLFKLHIQVTSSSYLFKLPIQVTSSSYLLKLPIQVTSTLNFSSPCYFYLLLLFIT